jgi:hypothetical protein
VQASVHSPRCYTVSIFEPTDDEFALIHG